MALQRRGLASLADALESSPFQRQRLRAAGLSTGDLSSFAALGALEPVTKSDLLAAGLERLASVPPSSRLARARATSGSSGEPFRFLDERRSLDRGNATRADVYERLGAGHGPVVELFDLPPDGPAARGRRGHGTPGLDRRTIGYRLPVREQAELVREIAPSVLYGNRSHLLLVAEELERSGPPVRSVRLVVSSSEMLTDADRGTLGEVFRAPVHDLYGLSEVQTIAWEPAPGSGYRVVAARVIVEVLRDGRPAAPGELGQVVVTSIDNHVMPFVRYATGDLARLPREPAPPGARTTTLRLDTIEGRRADGLVRADRTVVSPWQVATSTFWGRPEIAAACRRWQIDQHADLGVTVSVVPAGDTVPDAVAGEIERFVHDAVGTAVTVRTVDHVEMEPNGKFRAVRSAATPEGPATVSR